MEPVQRRCREFDPVLVGSRRRKERSKRSIRRNLLQELNEHIRARAAVFVRAQLAEHAGVPDPEAAVLAGDSDGVLRGKVCVEGTDVGGAAARGIGWPRMKLWPKRLSVPSGISA